MDLSQFQFLAKQAKLSSVKENTDLLLCVNQQNKEGCTLLHYVIQGNGTIDSKLEDVQSLLSIGANPNLQDAHGRTPLHYSVEHGIDPISTFLIGQNITEINIADMFGRTALHWAVKNNKIDICKEILNKGGNVNAVTTSKETPVHWAALGNYLNILQLLFQYNPNLFLYNNNNKQPFELCTSQECSILLQEEMIKIQTEENQKERNKQIEDDNSATISGQNNTKKNLVPTKKLKITLKR